MLSTEYSSSTGRSEDKHPFLAHDLTLATASRVLGRAPCRFLKGLKESRGRERREITILDSRDRFCGLCILSEISKAKAIQTAGDKYFEFPYAPK